MFIALTVLCRNEEDIIDQMISFHLSRGIDIVVATDNASTDSTREILSKYEQAGQLILLDEKSHTHDQSVWVSRMARIAIEEYGADWVINADADEFWWPQSGNFKQELAGISEQQNALQINRFNFIPPPLQNKPLVPFYESMIIREKQSKNSLGLPLPPKVCHRALNDVNVEDGNHAIRHGGMPVPSFSYSGIEILHFPVRNYNQFEHKIRLGYEAIQRNPRISNTGVGSTWGEIYRKHVKSGSLWQYYQSLRPSTEEIDQLIATGDLLHDSRLLKALANLNQN